MIVVDTNLIAYLIIQGDRTAVAQSVLQRDNVWMAPPLWHSEFRNVLIGYLRRGILDISDVYLAMGKAQRLLQGREFDVPSLQVLTLAAQSQCSAYDCEFVALAQLKRRKLITFDKRILREFPSVAIRPETFLSL